MNSTETLHTRFPISKCSHTRVRLFCKPAFFLCATLLSGPTVAAQTGMAVNAASTSTPSTTPVTMMEKIRFQLRLDGLHPKVVTVPEGEYQVILTNAAFQNPVFLIALDSADSVIAQIASDGKFRYQQALKLSLKAGVHKLQIAGHSTWTADLIVTGKGK